MRGGVCIYVCECGGGGAGWVTGGSCVRTRGKWRKGMRSLDEI